MLRKALVRGAALRRAFRGSWTGEDTLEGLLRGSLLRKALLRRFIQEKFNRKVSSWKALKGRKTGGMASRGRLKKRNCERVP